MKTTIIIDCGNSETRVFADCPAISDKPFSAIFENTFAREAVTTLLDDYLEGGNYDAVTSSAITFTRGQVADLKGTYVNGTLLHRNYERYAQKPNLNAAKFEDGLVTVAIINAVDKVMGHFASSSKEKISKQRLLERAKISLVLLAPPAQQKKAQAAYTSLFVENKVSYQDRFSGETCRLEVSEVRVIPEGMAAYVALRTTSEGKLREGFAHLDAGNVLILDVGAGTTDVVGVSKGQLMEASQYTVKKGGRNVLDVVKRSVEKTIGHSLSETLFEDTFSSGEVVIGNTLMDVTDLLDQGLDAVSSQIAREMVTHFASTSVELNAFNHLVVVGGGSLPPAAGSGLPSLSELLLEEIKRDVPEIALLKLENLQDPLFDNTQFSNEPSRYLNLWGSVILSRFLK